MVNSEMLTGKWNQIQGLVKQKWGKLTDNDLQIAGGNVDQLIGRIQQRTGEARETIESFLNESIEKGSDAMSKARETVAHAKESVQHAAGQVADKVRNGYDHANETVRDGYRAATEKFHDGQVAVEDYVKARPGQSMLMAFGIGVASGVGLALLLSNRQSACSRATNQAEGYARQVWDSIAKNLPDSIAKSLRS
ncbi:MAG: CsbD family protein [Pirellulales bacterium]